MQRIELPGFVMVLHGDNYLEERIIQSGEWEPSTSEFIRSSVRPRMTVADIGANIGYFSLLMASLVGPEGEVHAFEPYPGYVQRMKLSLAANSFTNIHVNEFALSSKKEHRELYKGLASARMHRWSHQNPVFNKVHDEVVVPCKTFDDYAAKKLKRLDLMKIDVDGFEMNVLQGARRSIDKYRPIIVIELYEQALKDAGTGAAEILELFRCSNYLPYSEKSRLFDYNTLLELVAKDPNTSINVVFRPELVADNSNSLYAAERHICNIRPRSKSKQGRTSGAKRRLGLVLDKDFHEKNQWCSATTFHLVEAIKARFEYVYIQSQSEYEESLGSVDILISMEPGWASPVLELTKTSALREKLSTIPSYIFYSDPHSNKWREDYFLNNGLDYILTFYYGPIRYHFRKTPPTKLVHFPWSVPDHWVGNSPIRFNGQSKICCFGGCKSDAYLVRNWCRTFDFVESSANSGVENKIMTDDEYIAWLSKKDAAIAAGSDSVKYRLTVPKYFEIPAAGSLVFAQYTEDLGLLGFKHNENCIVFDRSDFEKLAKEYLAHPQDYLNIRRAGRELIRRRHTVSRRMDFLQRHISMMLQQKAERQRRPLHRETNIHITDVARAADEKTLSIWAKYGLNNRPHEDPPVVTEFPEVIVLRGVYLRQLAEEVQAKYMAEVGTARGFQSFMLAQYLIDADRKDGIVYTCDIDGSDVPKYKTPLTGDQLFTREQLWDDAPQCEFVRFIHGDSGKLAQAIEHELDMVFIDGAHTEAAVKKDFEYLSPFLHPGSIVVFDDCDRRFPGEQKEVERISSSLGAETQLIDFTPHVYKLVVMRIPDDYTPPPKEHLVTTIQHKAQQNKPLQHPGSNPGKSSFVASVAAAGSGRDPDQRSSPDEETDEHFEAWFGRICIESILARAKKSPLLWQGRPLEPEVCHEIMAYHQFSGGRFSVEQLLALSNRRYELLDEIWPSEPITKERLQRFYEQSAQILPWGHGVFIADHKVGERRKNWLRRPKLLKMLKALGVDSVVDYGAGGGHTSLLAKAMGFSRVIHHEYGIFNAYVAWRAGFINSAVSAKGEQQFVISDAALGLSVSEPAQAVICSDVAEHVYDPDAMLEEIRQALAPNGYLVWSAMFGEGISCHLHGHLRGSEEELLERHGFKRAGDLPVHYPGHSGLYRAIPARSYPKNVPSDKQKTPCTNKLGHESNAIDIISADMDRNQWLSPDELGGVQWKRVKMLLEHAYEHVPFYRRRFYEAGFAWNDIRNMDDFRKIPILKKTDIQQNLEAMKASNYPADQLICDATGGSTGNPLTFFRNTQANAWIAEAAKRFRRWIGYQPQDKLALIWGADRDVPSSHPPNQRWLNSFNCSEQEIEAFVNDLVQWKPDAIRGYASSLYLVASYIKRKNLKAPHLKCIESAAEKLWAHQRALVEDVFQCRVFEMYGSREIPSLACECQVHGGLHVFSDIRLIEVIKNGRPAGPGADGSIIVTDLTNYGMPFIRYEIGDVGVGSDQICPCGRGFPLLKQVAGRVTNTIQTPDRRHIHGEYFTHLFYGAAGVRAFQVRQRSLDKIEVAVQPDAGFHPDLIENIVRRMQAHLGPQVNVQWETVDQIPPAPSGKRHFTISDVPVDFTGVSTEESKEVSKHAPATSTQAKARILFIVDVPGWAHEFKTDNLMRPLRDEYEMSKRYKDDVTADDIDKADLIVVYYWKEFNCANMKRLMDAFRQNRHKLLLGICSHVELEGQDLEKGLGILKELAAGVFVNNLFLYKEFSPVFDVPVFYTPNGVDTGFFTPSDDKKMSPALRVGWAGSLTNCGEIRGYSDLIVPAVDSVDGVELVTAAREQKWRSHEQMREFYRSLDVYICASRAEGTPNPCLEAAACGVPVLTTRVGNMPELIKHGVNGFFIERNVKDIVSKLTLLRDDPSLRRHVAQSMLRSIQQWDWRYQADNYRAMFERTLGPKPSVSVIIPCYNTAKYLAEAIESVLGQTYADFELIVVDDGSTDNTAQVVRDFDDERIRYLYQDNKGLAGARNTGMRHAHGRYLAFLDADDYFLPNKLADQVAFLENHPEIGLVAGGYLRVDTQGKQFHENKLNSPEMVPAKKILVVNVFPVHAMLIRRCWLDRVGFFDETLPAAEDWDLYCRLAILGCKMYRTTDVVCAYRSTPGSMSTNVQQQTDSMLRVVEKSFSNRELPLSLAVLEPKAKGFTHLKGSVRCFGAGLIDEGRRHLAQAVSYDPGLRNNGYKKVVDLLVFWARDHAHLDSPSEYIRSVFDNLPEEALDMQQSRATAIQRATKAHTTAPSTKVLSTASANAEAVDKGKIYEGLNKCYFSEQCHEKETIDHLPEILNGARTFVDIGASLGQYTFYANKCMQGAQIFAIEADPIRFEELKRNCSKWELLSTNRLTPLFAAASDKDGRETFYVTNSSTSGALFKRDLSARSVDWRPTTVNCLRLDGLFRDSSPDVVKIDVEGAELRVLKGATRILREGRTKFLIEVHGGADPKGQKDPEEVFRFMESFGYARLSFYGRSLFVNKVEANEETVEAKSDAVKITGLQTLANKYAGRRAFIIGNGPSLKSMDLTKLKDEITFGVNNIFYNFGQMGFKPTFYVVEDKLVAEDRAEEIKALTGMTKIFGTELQYCLAGSLETIWADVIYDFTDYPGFPNFSEDAAKCLWVGGTVSYLCMQLAYYMGFSDVYLVGFDHNYSVPEDAKIEGTVITSNSGDPNHFHPDYFGKGKRWHDPRTDRMELAYKRAKEIFERDGRKIYNATVGGKLEIFPRVDYGRLFAGQKKAPAVSSDRPSAVEELSSGNTNCDDKVRISVVVCTHCNPTLLTQTLDSLTLQTLSKELYEVIVVDNDSQDNTKDVVDGYLSVRYVLEEKLGLSHARNTGVHKARGDIIAFIDDDAEASPGWLQALLNVYDSVPDAWAVGGKVLPIWDEKKPEWLKEEYYRFLSLLEWGQGTRALRWPERIIGTNCSFRREVFSVIGHFKPELGRIGNLLLSFEDTEIQQRIHETDHSVYYSPEATVYHHVPAFRMTAEYFCSRSLGNIVSQIFMTLSQRGKSDEVYQCLNRFRNIFNSGAGQSNEPAEEQLLENVQSEFVLAYPDVPLETRVKFISMAARYYLLQEKCEKAEKKCVEGLALPSLSKAQICKLLLRLANVYLKQNKEAQAQQKLYEALCTAQIESEEAYHFFKALGEHYQWPDRYAQMEEKVDGILASREISEQNKVTAVRYFSALCLDCEKYSEAERLYLKFFPLDNLENTSKDRLFLGLGELYTKWGRYSEARKVLNKAVELESIIEQEKARSQSNSITVLNTGNEPAHVQEKKDLVEKPVASPTKPRFSHLVLDYTRLCNSRCTYCGIWKSKNAPELGLDSIEKTFAALRSFGLSTCYLTGGEPYISDKVVDIARLLHQYLPKCKISGATNGIQATQIIRRIRKILDIGVPVEVHISINGREATHDSTRGGQGFWKKAVYLLETLKSCQVPVVASMSLMPQTIEDLPYMQEFCAERDIRLMYSWVRQCVRYCEVDEDYSTWPEELKPKLRQIEYLPDEFDCVGLSKRLVVTPDGSLYPCEVYHPDILLGNVNEESLEAMLNSPRAASIMQMIANKGCHWCQGAGEIDGSPKWMLMDCYRRHSKQAICLAENFPQATNMPPQQSKQVIGSILSHKSSHQIPALIEQNDHQPIRDDNSKEQIRISVVVCTHRNPALLAKTLESLGRQTLPQELFEVIVVDNNSQDNTKELVARYPMVRYVLEERLGLSNARNTGVEKARGDIIAFIDDDAEADAQWLEALLRIYDSIPDAWAVGGKVLPIWDSQKPDWLTQAYYRALSLVEWGKSAKALCWPERIIGTNCSFRREVFSVVGHFVSELGRIANFTLCLEDTEIQQRIHKRGRLVYYTPDAAVYHHVPAHRMSREYINKIWLSNRLSEQIISLKALGKTKELGELMLQIRSSANIPGSDGGSAEHRILVARLLSLAVTMQHPDDPKQLMDLIDGIFKRKDLVAAETMLRACTGFYPTCQVKGYDFQFLMRKHRKWRELKDAFKGRRAFLIGNGPSLNATPLYLLKDEFTLCFNRFNLMFERLPWKPTMYMTVDERVAEDNADEINEISQAARFVFVPDIHPNGMDFRQFVKDADNVYWLTLDWAGFSRELPHAGLGGTVANVGLQVLIYMGFSPIYLVGVDMDYVDHATAIKHNARDWTSTRDDDPNHFDPRYFGKGKKYHYPRLHENMLPSMKLAKQEAERMGVRIINASIGGKLEVFPREDFSNLFNCTEKEKLSLFVQTIPGVQSFGDYSSLSEALPEAGITNSEAEFAACESDACIVPVRIARNLIFNHIRTHIPFGPCDGRYVFVRRPEYSTAAKGAATIESRRQNPAQMTWPEAEEDAKIVNEVSRHTSDHTTQLTKSERIDLLYDQIRANSSRLLMQYKDKYRGQRCVIMGNGPSLNNTDLSLLKNEFTFGLNKIYLLFDRIDWRPTFYVCVNPFVIQQSGQQILNDIPGLKFLDFVSFKYLPYNKDTVHLLSLSGKGFSTDPCEGVFQMHTVTYVAMQLAYYLGFDEVFLAGVDHFFNAIDSGQPDQVVVQNDYDSDHFDPNYFAKGQQWNLPNLKGSEEGYRIAKTIFEKANKKIYDATVGGHLSVFERVDFYEVFGNTKNSNLYACTGSGQ